jgi:uroporphyrinogen decarboxylase
LGKNLIFAKLGGMILNSKELFFEACRGNADLPRPPVWFMRQAGRYLPEYQVVRQKLKFLELCCNPELAAEVSLQPIEIIGVDAAIIFSDILLPLRDFGIEVDFPEIGGIRIAACSEPNFKNFQIAENIKATCKAISILQRKLISKNLQVPVLGFAGAPWTLLNYILEGGSSRNGEFKKAKQLAYCEPQKAHNWLKALSEMTIVYLKAQIEAGAEAVQLFDTWAGELTEEAFEAFVLPYCKIIFAELPKDIPKIFYLKNVGSYLELISQSGADILSLDWKLSLTSASERIKGSCIKCLQGNLDPLLLTLDPEIVLRETKKIIEEGRKLKCAHILNLGHGITPDAKVESAKAFVKAAKENF